MTRAEHAKYQHAPDKVGYGLGGCQALVNGYPDATCVGCREMLQARRDLREAREGATR